MAANGGLVGRRRELVCFDHRLKALQEGAGGVIEIEGEPGIGKSRLLAELGNRADQRGFVAVSGRAAQLEHEAPFAVFVDAFDPYLAWGSKASCCSGWDHTRSPSWPPPFLR